MQKLIVVLYDHDTIGSDDELGRWDSPFSSDIYTTCIYAYLGYLDAAFQLHAWLPGPEPGWSSMFVCIQLHVGYWM